MELTLLRNATVWIDMAGRRILVDPQLDPAEARPPVAAQPDPRRNPIAPLPVPPERCLEGVGAVLVTHVHADHWDATAMRLVPRDMPLFCQPDDLRRHTEQGFVDVRPLEATAEWEGITLTPTGGRHGLGELDDALGPVSGAVLAAEGEPTVYVAGDTVWCPEVAEVLDRHRPDIVVVNAGAARLDMGGPIVMDADQVVTVAEALPDTVVIAVHLEAIGHCPETRADVRERVAAAGLSDRVLAPEDGERLRIG